jgi:hypothetical protein
MGRECYMHGKGNVNTKVYSKNLKKIIVIAYRRIILKLGMNMYNPIL